MTPEQLASHIRTLEEKLLDPAIRADAEKLDALLADDFIEIGTSGRIYTKRDTLEQLPAEPGSWTYELTDFVIRTIAEGVTLATYKITTFNNAVKHRKTLRSSIWRLEPDGHLRLCFHQGTTAE